MKKLITSLSVVFLVSCAAPQTHVSSDQGYKTMTAERRKEIMNLVRAKYDVVQVKPGQMTAQLKPIRDEFVDDIGNETDCAWLADILNSQYVGMQFSCWGTLLFVRIF